MSATRVAGAAANSTTVSIPGSYQAGDLLILHAYRSGSTTATGTPTNGAWKPIRLLGFPVGTAFSTIWWRYAQSSSESAPVVSSATSVTLEVWRGAAAFSLQIGGMAASISATGTTITFPALTLGVTDGSSAVLRIVGATSATNLTTNTPTGYTAGAGNATGSRSCYATGIGSNPTAGTQSVSGSGAYSALSIEIMEKQAVSIVATMGDLGTAQTVGVSPVVDFSGGTFPSPDWIPQAGDMVLMVLRGTPMVLSAFPSGWANPLGGTTIVSFTNIVLIFAYHFVTSAEETAGTLSYTATNLLTASASTREIMGLVLRNVDTVTPVDSAATAGSSSTSTSHALPGLTGTNLSTGSLVIGVLATPGIYLGTAGVPFPFGNTWLVIQEGNSGDVVMRGALTTANTNVPAGTARTLTTANTWAAATMAFTQAPPPAINTGAFFAMF